MPETPETVRAKVIERLEALSTKHSVIYRSPISTAKDAYPAYVLEYGQNSDVWSSNRANKRMFMFNLYVVYGHDNTEESQELAEVAISECLGELYNVVFADPQLADIEAGWVKASDVTWGYGDVDDAPTRVAMLQLEVTVHDKR